MFSIETLWSLAKRNYYKLMHHRVNELDWDAFCRVVRTSCEGIPPATVAAIIGANRADILRYLQKEEEGAVPSLLPSSRRMIRDHSPAHTGRRSRGSSPRLFEENSQQRSARRPASVSRPPVWAPPGVPQRRASRR